MTTHRRKAYPRKRTAANTRAPTVRSPYGGPNNNDAHVRIEQVLQLVAFDGSTAFLRFRTRTGGGDINAFNQDITQSPEF